MTKISLKKILVGRIVGIVAVAVLIGAIFVLADRVQEVRRSLLMKQSLLEGSLKTAVYQASLQDQLIEYEADITRVEGMMPIQDEIGMIISYIEAEAKKNNITVKVPIVGEEFVYDKNGDKIEPMGSARAVRMQIQARGDPIALINFMHSIEHAPFLLGTVSFVFDSDSAVGGLAVNVPGSRPPGAESEKPEMQRAVLRMEVRLTTRVKKDIE